MAAGLIQAGLYRRAKTHPRGGVLVAAAAVGTLCGFVIWVSQPLIQVHQRRWLVPPSPAAVRALAENQVRCAYANGPHWISWHTETIAVYAPIDFDTVRTRGPRECRYLLHDQRRPLNRSAKRFLERRATLVDCDPSYALFRLQLD